MAIDETARRVETARALGLVRKRRPVAVVVAVHANLVAAAAQIVDRALVRRPRAGHDVAGGPRAGALLDRQERVDQRSQAFRRVDVVRDQHRRPFAEIRRWHGGEIAQQIGGQVERPAGELRPLRDAGTLAPADDRRHRGADGAGTS